MVCLRYIINGIKKSIFFIVKPLFGTKVGKSLKRKIYIWATKQKERIKERIFEKEFVLSIMFGYYFAYYSEEFEKRWEEVKSGKKHIYLHEYTGADAIGEILTRFLYIKESVTNRSDELHVFIPKVTYPHQSVGRIGNKYSIDLLGRYIYMVKPEEIPFWAYVVTQHYDEIDFSQRVSFRYRQNMPLYCYSAYNAPISLTSEEEKIGRRKAEELGIEEPYVCVSARTAVYNRKSLGITDSEYDHRNMDFHDFHKSISYLAKEGIETVRMGRCEKPMNDIAPCHDYAGTGGDDFEDFYLVSRCKFYLLNATGMTALAGILARPILVVNHLPISFGFGGFAVTESDMFIPKHYIDKRTKQELTLREIMNVELKKKCFMFYSNYKKEGIEFVDNSEEEILDAVKEMNQRLDGSWADTPEDEKNYKLFLEIRKEFCKEALNNKDNWLGVPHSARLCATYLRKHSFLLR